MKKKFRLLLLLVLLLTATTGAMAQDYYAPSTDEVIILNEVYNASNSGYSSHSAIAWGGAASTSNKKAGDPNNGGQQTSSTVICYSVKGTGQGKNITLSITGVSTVIVYHEKHTSRYIELRDGSKTGNIIGSGEKNTNVTEVELTATNKYSIFLHGTSDGSNDQDLYVYAIKLIAAPAPTSTYSVTLAEGTEDGDKWTIEPKTGLNGGETVTATYNGEKKVKSVKAVKKAAAPSVPDGAISGKFSVSGSKQVYFSKGNLRYASSKWSFFDNQYDYYTSYSADAWDKFGWSTSATDYGMNTSQSRSDYSGDFVDWGATMGTGWFTLSKDEWTYLFNTRSASTVGGTADGRYAKAKVNGVQGVILFPDTYTHPDGVTAPVGVNVTGSTGWNGNSYTVADWTKMESAGCVFLPAAGSRTGSSVSSPGTVGRYESATTNGTEYAYGVAFNSGILNPANNGSRSLGLSVRLVQKATSDAAPAVTYTLLSAATTSDYGKVVCAAGHLHDAKTAVPDGCTAVGILGKVTETGHGLILALKDAPEQEWNTINGWNSVTTYASTTLKVLPNDAARGTNLTSYTTLGETTVSNWAVAQKSDYEAIFTNLGSTTNVGGGYTCDGNVNAYITTGVGGAAITYGCWSATEYDNAEAWYFYSEYWSQDSKDDENRRVRPVLGF